MSRTDENAGDLEAVLKTTDPTELAVVKSMLEAHGIPFVVQGENWVGLFPLGPAGARVTGRSTGAIVLVPAEKLDEARALLDAPPRPARDGGPER